MTRKNPNNYAYKSPYIHHQTTPISNLISSDRKGLEFALSNTDSSPFSRDKIGSCLQCV